MYSVTAVSSFVNNLHCHSWLLGTKNKTNQGLKSAERQMIIMLFLVTVALLLLTSPQYVRYIVATSWDYNSTPEGFASFYLLVHVSNKLFTTNYCINFFLYVTSGTKFRSDLKNLILRKKRNVVGDIGTGSTFETVTWLVGYVHLYNGTNTLSAYSNHVIECYSKIDTLCTLLRNVLM